MNKSRGWVIVWLGLVASAGALANNAAQESAVKSGLGREQVVAMAGTDSVSYVAAATNTSQGSTSTSKLPSGSGYDTGTVPGPSSLPFILAGLGALAVSATRRRSR